MSATRLLILGLVRWLQPVHGYDVRRELLSWNVEQWANIAPGSIYHALRKLTQEQLLEEVATEQVGGRPARTRYRVTRRGEEEFEELLRRFWWEYREPIDPFYAAFSLLPALPRDEAVAALRNRARVLTTEVERGRAAIRLQWMDTKPEHVRWIFELTIARLTAEIEWCEQTAARVAAGEGAHDGEVDPSKGASFAATYRNAPGKLSGGGAGVASDGDPGPD